MKTTKYILPISLLAVALAACNRGEELTTGGAKEPVITLDSETGVCTAKVGRELTITPTVENSEGAVYQWLIDDEELIGTQATLTRTFSETGSVYITFRVQTDAGSDKADLRVDVVEAAAPVISLAISSGGLTIVRGSGHLFSPDVRNGEDAVYAWYMDGEVVGTERDYTFMRPDEGTFQLKITAENEDGADEKSFTVEVVASLPVSIVFPKPMWSADPLKKSVPLGRTLYLRPYVENAIDPVYSWSVDDVVQTGEEDRLFGFTPAAKGAYEVVFTVTDSESRITRAELTVTCYGTESELIKNTTGDPAANKVYEYLPAPGQFVNEPATGGFSGEETFDEAAAYAERRLEEGRWVSLGGWGGYIIVGFDHSIENKGGYKGCDFSIRGNQQAGGSEPGIVWVMQDTNGNSLPDDEWYELKGSEYGGPGTVQEYAVTYYRPGGKGMDTRWTDNLGASGRIDYLAAFHTQDYYYPLWMESDTCTLYGTRLEHRTEQQSGGLRYNGDFGWGYADNKGEDMPEEEEGDSSNGRKTCFKISNAVDLSGGAAGLEYIDFIKVQTGVNTKAGGLGEVSTEVLGFEDENL